MSVEFRVLVVKRGEWVLVQAVMVDLDGEQETSMERKDRG